jgi:hypothetical protein
MKEQRVRQEQRRYVRKSGLQVRVSVRDQSGHVCQGTVFDASAGGFGLFTESLPCSQLLEIQPANSALWVRVITKRCTSFPFGTVLGCAFRFPPTPEILQALSGFR